MFKLSTGKIFSILLFSSIVSSTLIAQNESNSATLNFYRYIPKKMTWSEHQKLAALMGGTLACITNATENNQVRGVANGEAVWIGGIRKGYGNGPGSGHWKWSNGKEWSYTNWSEREPNNYLEQDENRVMFYETGEWNDVPMWWRGPAVYEIRLSISKDVSEMAKPKDLPKSILVSGAGSSEVNGNYVFVEYKHKNRILGTEAGHYQHTKNPSIFIGFQNCERFGKPEWNKWVIFTEKGVRYAAHTNRQINVPPRIGKWETVHHWPNSVEKAGSHPAPTITMD